MTEMTVDLKSKWEEVFRKTAWARYPSEEMIRFVARTFSQVPDRSQIRFLDLGCGIGTACWYLAREGYTAEGIDGSDTAIATAREWMANENLNATFQVAMMQSLPFEDNHFEAIVDNASVTSCPLPVINSILAEAYRVLKPGGIYFGIYFGDECTITGIQNKDSSDPAFYEEITSGPLQRAATVRALTRTEMGQALSKFSNVTIDYGLRTVFNEQERVHYWYVTAKKPA